MPRPEEHLSPTRPLGDGEAERLAERMAAFATASRIKLLYALIGDELAVDQREEQLDPAGGGEGGHALGKSFRLAARKRARGGEVFLRAWHYPSR